MISLLDYYGKDSEKRSNRTYSLLLKQEATDKVLKEGYSQRQVAVIDTLLSMAIISIWLAKYKEKGIVLLKSNEVEVD